MTQSAVTNYEIVVQSGQSSPVLLTPGDPVNLTELDGETVGQAITEIDIKASGGTSPYTFVVTGTLPPGIESQTDDVDTLRLTGTPTTTGTFDFAIQATDSLGNSAQTKFRKVAAKK